MSVADAPARARSSAAPASGLALAIAGSASVATAFGMARYSYGLLLPDIRHDLALGEAEVGAIGTLAYVTYILAAAVVGPAVARWGPRAPVVAGGALGAAGTAVVAVGSSPPMLALGVGIAGMCAGLVYPPFGEAIRRLPDRARARAMAAVTCGTGWGVAIAAPIAIVAGSQWRLAYLGFAVCTCLSTIYAARVLPSRDRASDRPDDDSRTPDRLDDDAAGRPAGGERTTPPRAPAIEPETRRRRSLPRLRPGLVGIVAGAVLVGLGSGAYWTFAVEQARDAGLSMTSGRILLGVAGIGGLLGLSAADLVRRLGTRTAFAGCALLEAASLAALAVAPANLPIVLASALAFGAAYNTIIAISIFAAAPHYADRPASAVAIVAGANSAGLVVAPLAGGALAGAIGLTATLAGGAAVLAAAALVSPGAAPSSAPASTSVSTPARDPRDRGDCVVHASS